MAFDPSTATLVGEKGAFDPSSATLVEEAPPVKKPGLLGSVADSGLAIARGATQGARVTADAFGANNDASKFLSDMAEGIGDARSDYAKDQERIAGERSREAEATGSGWEEVKAGVRNFADRPLDSVLEGVGSSVIPLAAMAATRGKVNPLRIGQATGGVMGVGAVKGEIYEAVKQREIAAGKTDAEAEKTASDAQSYTGDNLDQIALGGGLGVVAGGTGVEGGFTRMLSGKSAPGLRKTAAEILAEGTTEGAQGGQERLAANIASQRAGYEDVPTWGGVLGQATAEGLAGAGSAGVFSGAEAITDSLRKKPVSPQPETQPEAEPLVQQDGQLSGQDDLLRLQDKGFVVPPSEYPGNEDAARAAQANADAVYDERAAYEQQQIEIAALRDQARNQFVAGVQPENYTQWASSLDIEAFIQSMPPEAQTPAIANANIIAGDYDPVEKENAAQRLWDAGQQYKLPTPETLPVDHGPLAGAVAAGVASNGISTNDFGFLAQEPIDIQPGEESEPAAIPVESNQGQGNQPDGSGVAIEGFAGQPGQPDSAALDGSERTADSVSNPEVGDVSGLTTPVTPLQESAPNPVTQFDEDAYGATGKSLLDTAWKDAFENYETSDFDRMPKEQLQEILSEEGIDFVVTDQFAARFNEIAAKGKLAGAETDAKLNETGESLAAQPEQVVEETGETPSAEVAPEGVINAQNQNTPESIPQAGAVALADQANQGNDAGIVEAEAAQTPDVPVTNEVSDSIYDKPFETEDLAKLAIKAKKLQNVQVFKKPDGTFYVGAANEKPGAHNRKYSDDLITRIIAMGGIKSGGLARDTLGETNGNKLRPGLFSENGLELDGIIEKGTLATEFGITDTNTLQEAIANAINGGERTTSFTGQEAEGEAYIKRKEREAFAEQAEMYVEEAKELGIDTVGKKADEIRAEILAHHQEIDRLESIAKQDEVVDAGIIADWHDENNIPFEGGNPSLTEDEIFGDLSGQDQQGAKEAEVPGGSEPAVEAEPGIEGVGREDGEAGTPSPETDEGTPGVDRESIREPDESDRLDELEQEARDRLFDAPEKTTRAEDVAKETGFISQPEADAILDSWHDTAVAQDKGDNAGKTILSLFDHTGAWSQPYVDAGYDVVRIDLQDGVDVNDFSVEYLIESLELDNVHGILAACPCTDFSASGARWWNDKDADGRTEASIELVKQTLRTIEYFNPKFWAIENPVGRIQRLAGLQNPRLIFQPHHYGDPYTKKTLLYGQFSADLPQANVEPTEGSRVHKLRGDDPVQKAERSTTPDGFAYAFFMANGDVKAVAAKASTPALELTGQTPEQAKAEDEARIAAEKEQAAKAKRDAAKEKADAEEAERKARASIAASEFKLDATEDNAENQIKADKAKADDQFAGQGSIFDQPAAPAPKPTELTFDDLPSLFVNEHQVAIKLIDKKRSIYVDGTASAQAARKSTMDDIAKMKDLIKCLGG